MTHCSISIKGCILVIAVLILSALTGCTKLPQSETRSLLGTQVSITVHDYNRSKLKGGHIPAAIDSAFREIKRVEDLARWDEMKKLNEWAGYDPYPIGDELISLIDYAYLLSEYTDYTFRPDLGPLVTLWGFEGKRYDSDSISQPRIPLQWEIDAALEIVDSTIFSVPDSGFGYLEPVDARLDLGGVAKGYAVDRAVVVLEDLGVTAGMVWAGGDLRVFGDKPEGGLWRIAVRHPRNPEEFSAVIELEEGAVATSGDYERYFEIDNARYHHILDPATGYPSRASISATAVAETCTDADAYATAFFVLGPEEGAKIAMLLDVPALIINETGDDELVVAQTRSFEIMRSEREHVAVSK